MGLQANAALKSESAQHHDLTSPRPTDRSEGRGPKSWLLVSSRGSSAAMRTTSFASSVEHGAARAVRNCRRR